MQAISTPESPVQGALTREDIVLGIENRCIQYGHDVLLHKFLKQRSFNQFVPSEVLDDTNLEQVSSLIHSALNNPGMLKDQRFVSDYAKKLIDLLPAIIAEEFGVSAEVIILRGDPILRITA